MKKCSYCVVLESNVTGANRELNFDDILGALFSLQSCGFISHYAFIKHDSDVNKRNHWHLILTDCILTFDNFLTELAGELTIRFEVNYPLTAISIEKVKNLRKCYRYLIHKDNRDKHLYNASDIYNDDDYYFSSYLVDKINEINYTEDDIIVFAFDASCVRDLLHLFGISAYMKYRNVIRDLRPDLFKR